MKNQKLRITAIILAIIGLVTSLYLLWIKISNNQALCLPGIGDCWSVNTSIYSEFLGIPVSIFGAGGYIAILVVLFAETRYKLAKFYSQYAMFGLTLLGVIVSAILTYLELAVIHAVCPFCVLSAIVMTLLFILTIVSLVKYQSDKNQ
jgi:uncharacterized membrane protein